MISYSNIKNRIRANFNKAAKTYDENCEIHNTICQRLLEILTAYNNDFGIIADFACGTGESTVKLHEQVNCDKCYAIDFAEDLLSTARKKFSPEENTIFLNGDLDEMVFENLYLDFIFSNMGLQWAKSLSHSISLFHEYLKPKGLLLFSMPIDENFPEIKPTYKLKLAKHSAIIEKIRSLQFKLLESKVISISVTYPCQLTLFNSLKGSGTNYNKKIQGDTKGLSKPKLQQYFLVPENTMLTYKTGLYLARKKT